MPSASLAPGPIPRPGQCLSPSLQRWTIILWDNPHLTMKIQSLIPMMAVLAFAASAAAQSDPSVGGSFGGMPLTAGTVSIANPAPIISTPSRAQVQTQPSFWNRLTGRNSTMPQGSASRSSSSHGWFGQHHASNYRPAQHHNWFGTHHNPPMVQAQTTRASTTSSTRSSGWHLPFFNRR